MVKVKALTASEVDELVMVDQVSKKRDGSGNFVFRKGYFYRHGADAQQFADQVKQKCNDAELNCEVVDHGDHWASFKGGASLAKSSHFWVVATVTRK